VNRNPDAARVQTVWNKILYNNVNIRRRGDNTHIGNENIEISRRAV